MGRGRRWSRCGTGLSLAQQLARGGQGRPGSQHQQHQRPDDPAGQRPHGSSIRPPPRRARRDARHSRTRRSRSALPITDTELKVMAALAIMGLSSSPNEG